MDPSYNNSFGTQPPVSSGTGDIVLQPDKPAKSKKGIFIGIGVLLVLLVVALMVFLATGGGKGSNGSGSGSNDNVSVETAFNRYANYLVSGEVKDSEVSSERFDSAIKLDEEYEDKEYEGEAAKLYKSFYDAIVSHGDGSFAEYDVTRILDDYNFLTSHFELAPVDSATLMKKYTEGGYDKALTYLRESTASEDEDLISSYNKYRLMFGEAFIKYLAYYDSIGCLNNGEINLGCDAAKSTSEAETLLRNVFEAQRMCEGVVDNAWSRIREQAIRITERDN